jgi:hypothetical protein
MYWINVAQVTYWGRAMGKRIFVYFVFYKTLEFSWLAKELVKKTLLFGVNELMYPSLFSSFVSTYLFYFILFYTDYFQISPHDICIFKPLSYYKTLWRILPKMDIFIYIIL